MTAIGDLKFEILFQARRTLGASSETLATQITAAVTMSSKTAPTAMIVFFQLRRGDDEGGEEDIDERGFEKNHPAKFHELVITEPRHGPTDEDEEQDEADQFGHEAPEMDESAEVEVADVEFRDHGVEPEAD